MRGLMLAAALSVLSLPALAAKTSTYQVTGEVKEVTPDTIVVMKGKERHEIARTADTKVTGTPEVGSKVTVEYRMTATAITVKEAGAKKGAKAK